MKKSESIALGQSMEESKLNQSLRNTDCINQDDYLANLPDSEEEISFFWQRNCLELPDKGKVGEFIVDNEQIIFEIESYDIWVKVKL